MSELWAITGASGFLGRALRADLQASGIACRGLARGGDAEIAGDVRDAAAVRALVRGASVVVHLAAYVHQSARGADAARECWSVNVDGMQTLLDAVAAESPNAFVIFVSTANVYGPSEAARDESAPCRPETPYGRSKLEAERRLLARVAGGWLRGCVLRPATIFGPGAPGNLAKLARMARSGWAVEVAYGAQRKSVVPVSHVAGAIRAVADHQSECNGEVINVAGEILTIHEILAAFGPRMISIPRWLVAPVAAIVPLLRTYMTNAEFRGDKLGRLTGFRSPESVAEALGRVARAPM
jgi:nucleoside-diphosphate-sugar epimerase